MEKEQLIPIILSTTPFLNRQKEITKFLGIPVDGTRSEMIKKLKKKGFSATPTFGDFVLEGKFKGNDVYLYMLDYKDKVFSVYIRDKKPISEADIKYMRYTPLAIARSVYFPLPPSAEEGGFLRSKKTEGEI